jgi:hypothetical protein
MELRNGWDRSNDGGLKKRVNRNSCTELTDHQHEELHYMRRSGHRPVKPEEEVGVD